MKKILVVGYAHGGTGSTALLLQKLGYDIRHDLHTGRHGSVSWLYAVDDEFFDELSRIYPGQRPAWNIKNHGRATYDVILHQIRDPLKSIGDASLEPSWTLDFRFRHFPEIRHNNGLIMGLRSWILWHELCEKGSQWSYRVEELNQPDIWRKFLSMCGINTDAKHPLDTAKHNTKRHLHKAWKDDRTWDELYNLDKGYAIRAYNFATRHGYEYDWKVP